MLAAAASLLFLTSIAADMIPCESENCRRGKRAVDLATVAGLLLVWLPLALYRHATPALWKGFGIAAAAVVSLTPLLLAYSKMRCNKGKTRDGECNDGWNGFAAAVFVILMVPWILAALVVALVWKAWTSE